MRPERFQAIAEHTAFVEPVASVLAARRSWAARLESLAPIAPAETTKAPS